MPIKRTISRNGQPIGPHESNVFVMVGAPPAGELKRKRSGKDRRQSEIPLIARGRFDSEEGREDSQRALDRDRLRHP